MSRRTEMLYAETQRFRQWWFLALVGVIILLDGWLVIAVQGWAVVQQVVLAVPWGNNPASDGVLLSLTLVWGVLFPIWLLALKLEVQVWTDGVHLRFWPLHLGWVHIAASTVASFEAGTYRPIRSYGGWGLRWGVRNGRRGKAYNVSGNQGVMLLLDDGRHVTIGSLEPDQLAAAIQRMIDRRP